MNNVEEIVMYFFNITNTTITASAMRRQKRLAKILLNEYSLDEIADVIDYAVKEKKYNIYSLGFFLKSISDYVKVIRERKAQKAVQSLKIEIKEVKKKEDRRERNNRRANSNKSKQRKSDFINYFEGK